MDLTDAMKAIQIIIYYIFILHRTFQLEVKVRAHVFQVIFNKY